MGRRRWMPGEEFGDLRADTEDWLRETVPDDEETEQMAEEPILCPLHLIPLEDCPCDLLPDDDL